MKRLRKLVKELLTTISLVGDFIIGSGDQTEDPKPENIPVMLIASMNQNRN